MGQMIPRQQGQGGRAPNARSETIGPPRPLWFIDSEGKTDVILVQTGISDGSRTAIIPRPADGAIEGKEIIMRERIR